MKLLAFKWKVVENEWHSSFRCASIDRISSKFERKEEKLESRIFKFESIDQRRTILEKLKYEVGKGLRFWSVRSQKIAWNFFGAKNAQNQRFTSISKSRVSCKPVKIQYFNL